MLRQPVWILIVIAAVLTLGDQVPAQDIFGGGESAGGGDPFGGGGDPVAAPSGGGGAAQPAEAEESDPVIRAIRASDPTTPEELARAIRNVMNLGRVGETKKYARRLIDAAPEQGDLVKLHRKFGGAMFLRLFRDKRYAPEGMELGTMVLDAATQAARDPALLNQLISQLRDPAAEIRHAALVDLRSGGTASVVALIKVLADSGRAPEHAIVRRALANLGSVSIEPLLGSLDSGDAMLTAQAFVVLSKLGSGKVIPYLLGPYAIQPETSTLHKAARYSLLKLVGDVPDRARAQSMLAGHVDQFLKGKLTSRVDHEDLVTLWGWDPARGEPVSTRFLAEEASLIMAARLASDLYAIDPKNVDHQRLYVMTLLEATKLRNGVDQPLPLGEGTFHAAAVQLGQDVMSDVLAYAIRLDRAPAATGAIEILGDIGDVKLLQTADGRASTLALALIHPNRRVRFAAVEAIMKIDPQQPFPGASYLTETLGYLAGSVGSRRVLIAHPRIEHAQTLVGLLNQLGFEADTAPTGRHALNLAVRHPDYEMILLSDAIDRPPVRELIQHLRREPKTQVLPIGVIARQETARQTEFFAETVPLVTSFPRPHQVAGLQRALQQVLQLAGVRAVTEDERLQHAIAALDHLAKLAEQSETYSFYDLLRQQSKIEHGLNTPALAEPTSRVLGLFGSPSAQRRLVNYASANSRRLSERQAAASAFDVAIKRRGLLLARGDILLQYDRYNQSKNLDRDTQEVLGALLDSIEAPTRVEERGDQEAQTETSE